MSETELLKALPNPLDSQELLSLIEKLCGMPSVSAQGNGENECAKVIFEELEKITPAHGNSFFAEIVPCEKDPLGRQAVFALLEPPVKTRRTVLLTGHFDVVEVEDAAREIIFKPSAYTQYLKDKDLPSGIKKDLESGNWLFGRGTMDMKAGLALFIKAMEKLAQSPDLKINILFLAVPDEEADSWGMRGAMPHLMELLKKEGLDLAAALTGEPAFWTGDSETPGAYRPYYVGSTGKIMPFVYAVGAEAHIGCYFEGVNAALMISEAVSRIEADCSLNQGGKEGLLTPPACLGMMTRRKEYSVSLPTKASAYFNVLTISQTPEDILAWAKRLCREAADKVNEKLQASFKRFAETGGYQFLQKEILVMSVAEVEAKARAASASPAEYEKAKKAYVASLPKELDAREKELRILEWMIKDIRFDNPVYIVGFMPPFYPARVNTNKNAGERKLRKLINEAAEMGGELAGDNANKVIEIFAGITDLSYLGFTGTRKDLEAFTENLPGSGSTYWLPVEALLELDVPVGNMAGAGRDAHKQTERLELKYSLDIAPKLLFRTLSELQKDK